MALPKFVLGHNSLIGVHHTDKKMDKKKSRLSDKDIEFLDFAIKNGIKSVVLDNHPVAIETAKFLESKSDIEICPMIPYAQAVVDKASKTGLSGVVKEMASSMTPFMKTIYRSVVNPRNIGLTQIGAHLATTKYLSEYPKKNMGSVCFLHNVVTDLMLGWNSKEGIKAFSKAIEDSGMIPGFVTLNPQLIPEIVDILGKKVWFMTSVNSAGIQMGPDRTIVEEQILSDGELNIMAMSLLGGGILDPKKEIPRALSFPGVKSVVVGTSSKKNLAEIIELISSTN